MSLLSALALFGTIGTPELLIVLVIVILIFGASKLPQLGGALGKTIKSFKQEMKDGAAEGTAAGPRSCTKCGAEIKDKDATFCPKCGQAQ
jgi:sec-independent protein translocase protein TatA